MSTTETPTALAGLVGEWEGTVRTWFEPGQLADESPIRARIRSLGPQDEEHPGRRGHALPTAELQPHGEAMPQEGGDAHRHQPAPVERGADHHDKR